MMKIGSHMAMRVRVVTGDDEARERVSNEQGKV
jgi:hypothetical protein